MKLLRKEVEQFIARSLRDKPKDVYALPVGVRIVLCTSQFSGSVYLGPYNQYVEADDLLDDAIDAFMETEDREAA